jgi:hypothetical protein
MNPHVRDVLLDYMFIVHVNSDVMGVFGTALLPFFQLRSSSTVPNTSSFINSAPRKTWSWRPTPRFWCQTHLASQTPLQENVELEANSTFFL